MKSLFTLLIRYLPQLILLLGHLMSQHECFSDCVNIVVCLCDLKQAAETRCTSVLGDILMQIDGILLLLLLRSVDHM